MSHEVVKATSINEELERVPTGTLKNTDSASARVHKGGGGAQSTEHLHYKNHKTQNTLNAHCLSHWLST